MDDGTMQAITQDSDAFHAGERVQVTPEGRVRKVPAAQTSAPLAVRPGERHHPVGHADEHLGATG